MIERCQDCGSHEFVTRPNGTRRCARFMHHGEPAIERHERCAARITVEDAPMPELVTGLRCERRLGHPGQHHVEYQPPSPARIDRWWDSAPINLLERQ